MCKKQFEVRSEGLYFDTARTQDHCVVKMHQAEQTVCNGERDDLWIWDASVYLECQIDAGGLCHLLAKKQRALITMSLRGQSNLWDTWHINLSIPGGIRWNTSWQLKTGRFWEKERKNEKACPQAIWIKAGIKMRIWELMHWNKVLLFIVLTPYRLKQ